ncbi:MAG: hypothetical protein HC849_04800 [Oscillatoriales cyanobacterium RU_3_3]|nr:hypothetical protein [Microcoleus sp. SU_5_6]NJL67037.1 hypothetical protein [Microcoleus sp. SM1_3_4]NJM59658.1 hypothetical protein [Oscillatoriales cyanobacterium RU_3_3]NJR23849.1 hypothetical protein [Richelia sp. CSU_2_1]
MAVERWTDEMLDKSASNFREVRESITEIRDGIDGLRVTAQALLQVGVQSQRRMDQFDRELELMKQQHAENDARFNVLLEEVRYLIRGDRGN